MTFVVIGGGPTGVEMAGQLKELSSRALRRNYRRIDPSQTRVVLVEGGDALVATMGERLSRITRRDLTRLGVEVHLGAMVTGMDAECVTHHPVRRVDRGDPGCHQDLGGRDRAAHRLGALARPRVPASPSTAAAGSRSTPTARYPAIPRSSWWAT